MTPFIITYFKLIENQNRDINVVGYSDIITYFKLIENQNLIDAWEGVCEIITYFKLIENQNLPPLVFFFSSL